MYMLPITNSHARARHLNARAPTPGAVKPTPDNPVFKQLLDLKAVEAQVESLFLRVLGRPPAKAEARALRRFSKGADRVQFLQDLWWALLNSSEFLYNH